MDSMLIGSDQIDRIFAKIDTSGSNFIKYSEFVTACLDRSVQLSDQNLELAFASFANDEGLITEQQIRKVFKSAEDNLKSKVWLEMTREFHKNEDDAIDKDEFFEVLRRI